MPDMPRTKFNSPWTVANIEAELNGTKAARGNLTMSEKLEQKVETSLYSTDKTALDAEIAAVANAGAKNYCPYNTITATGSGTIINDQPINLPAGTYILTFKHTASTGSTAFRLSYDGTSVESFTVNNSDTGTKSREFTLASAANQFRVYTSISNTYTEVMIRRKEVADATYQPYAPTNRELYEMILALQNGA